MFQKIVLFLMIGLLVGCGVSKPTIVTTRSFGPDKPNKNKRKNTIMLESTSKTLVTNKIVDSYVLKFCNVAMNNMKSYGIPASIILAQGILESGAGNGDLALSANNHFGIKCHKDWLGESVRHDDDASQECFRKYNNPAESYKDHATFLTGGTRYSSLFSLPKGDYKAWAKGLKAAGYATDPNYPEKLISYVELYNLHQYDNRVLGKTNIKYDSSLYEVQKGDTLYSLSKKFNISVEDLRIKNNIIENSISLGQQLIVK
jgi:flagellum-specific peptidoglycan hydrolase FlgJ